MSTFGYSYWQRREPLVPREQMWAKEEAKSIEERRRRYRCRGDYVTLEDVATWPVYLAGIAERRKEEREAHHKWVAQQWRAYRQRKALREAKKKRIEEKRQRNVEREEKRQLARQLKEEERAREQQEQQEKIAQEEQNPVEQPTQQPEREEGEPQTTAAGGEAPQPEEAKPVIDAGEEVDEEEDDLSTSSEESELSSSEEEPSEKEEDEEAEKEETEEPLPTAHFAPDEELSRIVTMWRGDITHLEIDAIVNAANRSLLGGGGIDGAIHRAAGDDLYNECRQLNGCATGHCKITRGYALPAKYVLHTVGPIGENPVALRSCYLNCLRVAVQNGVRSLAFCGISTGIYGYPLYEASHIALRTVRRWLEEGDNRTKFDRIIFCVFLDKERVCYERLMPLYFPAAGAPYEVLPMQPGEELEVPPMAEEEPEESSSSEEDGSDNDDSDDDGEEEGIPDAPPPPTTNAANVEGGAEAQLATGMEALAISVPPENKASANADVTAGDLADSNEGSAVAGQ